MAHTSGPWKVETWDYPHATPPRKELNIVSPERLLATLQCDFTGDNPYTVQQTEAEANARLFAASKDLLEALEDACLSIAVHGEQPPETWLSAIAKARGEVHPCTTKNT